MQSLQGASKFSSWPRSRLQINICPFSSEELWGPSCSFSRQLQKTPEVTQPPQQKCISSWGRDLISFIWISRISRVCHGRWHNNQHRISPLIIWKIKFFWTLFCVTFTILFLEWNWVKARSFRKWLSWSKNQKTYFLIQWYWEWRRPTWTPTFLNKFQSFVTQEMSCVVSFGCTLLVGKHLCAPIRI